MPSTLEGQIVRASDVIAYVNHDIDDALRAGVIKEKDIPPDLVKILGRWPATRVDRMVVDLVTSSLKAGLARIAMSPAVMEAMVALRDFLYERVYGSAFARDEVERARKVVTDLYDYLLKHPDEYVKPYPQADPLAVRVADFIAGMTDRYALALFEELFLPRSIV